MKISSKIFLIFALVCLGLGALAFATIHQRVGDIFSIAAFYMLVIGVVWYLIETIK